jgi:hypothetical protein
MSTIVLKSKSVTLHPGTNKFVTEPGDGLLHVTLADVQIVCHSISECGSTVQGTVLLGHWHYQFMAKMPMGNKAILPQKDQSIFELNEFTSVEINQVTLLLV